MAGSSTARRWRRPSRAQAAKDLERGLRSGCLVAPALRAVTPFGFLRSARTDVHKVAALVVKKGPNASGLATIVGKEAPHATGQLHYLLSKPIAEAINRSGALAGEVIQKRSRLNLPGRQPSLNSHWHEAIRYPRLVRA